MLRKEDIIVWEKDEGRTWKRKKTLYEREIRSVIWKCKTWLYERKVQNSKGNNYRRRERGDGRIREKG